MTDDDRRRWDAKYAGRDALSPAAIGPPAVFDPYQDEFPTAGLALELACGEGATSVWLALRGLTVQGVDVSGVAIDRARNLARRSGVADRCRFDIADLDDGLPPGPAADVIICHRFRDRRLDRAIAQRLVAGGLLALTALSEVGGTAGRYRAATGELSAAFDHLHPITAGEADGEAWLLARAPLR